MPRTKIYLIGAMKKEIVGSKLPSQKDCLSVLFYNMRVANMNLSNAANLVIDKCLIFWKKARIPTKDRSDCVKKIKKLYETWRNLEKNCKRLRATQKSKEKMFEENMNNLFDIAHVNALNLISIEEDKEFLIAQRKPNRVGSMIGIDLKVTAAEKRKCERKTKEEARKHKAEAEMLKYHALVPVPRSYSTDSEISDVGTNRSTGQNESRMSTLSSSSSSDLYMNVDDNISQEPSTSVATRGSKLIVNSRLSAALDKCKVSDRDAVHLLSACVESLSLNPMDYVINRSSIRRARQQHREDTAINIQSEFMHLNVDFAVVHWDTKLLPNVTGMEKQDRLPIIVTTPLTDQLLGVPHIPSGSGKEISSAVFDTLKRWGLLDKVEAFVFDTTSSNTGRFNGACTLLEMKLERSILFLACRHHIFELVLQAAIFSVKLYSSSGPDIPLFKKFKASFPKMNSLNILNCDTSSELVELIGEKREETLLFCLRLLGNDQQNRHDYTEFLELVVMLLGGTIPKGNKIRKPGAYHQARWMAKAIYSIKIFLLRSEFAITEVEEKALCRICGFIVVNYIKSWFTANKTTEAPWNDILLLKNLNKYKEKDETVAGACLQKFVNHLWYLSDEPVLFSLFDDNVPLEEKQRMSEKLRELINSKEIEDVEDDDLAPKKYLLHYDELNEFLDKDLPCNLITKKSLNLFKRFKLCTSFIQSDASEWSRNESYNKGKEILTSINVVNDSAERGVKLMEEFNTAFTKNENQKQFILQVVQNYRNKYPQHTRKSMSVPYK